MASVGTIQASMEPHFLQCGNELILKGLEVLKRGFNGAALLTVRKRRAPFGVRPPGASLQWSRTSYSAETVMRAFLNPQEPRGASMEPHFLQCGNFGNCEALGSAAPPASMEPHFLQCGNWPSTMHRFINSLRLQWSRTSYSAETRLERSRCQNS